MTEYDRVMVQYLNDEAAKGFEKGSGYTSPGWYFWDETGARCIGPYAERVEAEDALNNYAGELNQPKSNLQLVEWIQTFSGKKLPLLFCQPEDIRLEDIAHSLSLQCRFTGHSKVHYSVAQHSLYVSDCCPPRLQAWGLLHDAHEMVTGDINRPMKRLLARLLGPPFTILLNQIETSVELALKLRFGLQRLADEDREIIRQEDDFILATERRDVMAPSDLEWENLPEPWEKTIEPLDWRVVKSIFLDRAGELGLK
jgi:5'-deoxynucleotidase YfbR-like HD superfamily hydrolase